MCTDGKIMLWDAKDYGFNPLGSFSTPEGGVCCAALRSTQTIILGYEHGAVQLWRLPEIPTPSMSHDSSDKWQLAGALCLASSEPHVGKVTSLSCAMDGRLLLSSSVDHTVVLWSLADFTPLRTFVFSKPAAQAVCLQPPTGFLAALGEQLEHVPIPEENLPLPADASAFDAAQLLLAAERVSRHGTGGHSEAGRGVGEGMGSGVDDATGMQIDGVAKSLSVSQLASRRQAERREKDGR